MYEVRLYAMASPERSQGHLVDGIGVPSGNMFNFWAGEFGGYNSSAQGDRNIEAMESCEYPGADMDFTYDTPNDENNTDEITYFLALIAEHGEGTVKFTVQTDFESPILTILDPPEISLSDQPTTINVKAIDSVEVKEVWIEYSDDDGTTFNQVDLTKNDETWSGDIPAFEAGSLVNYTVWSKDQYDNEGGIDSSFLVKTQLNFNVEILDRSITTGQEVEVEGQVNLYSNLLNLTFTHNEITETISVPVDDDGQFSGKYYPVYPGEWTMTVSYIGDELTLPGESEEIEFTKYPVDIKCNAYSNLVLGNQKAVISGATTLKASELMLAFIHQDASYNLSVVTTDEGNYEYSFSPDKLGEWRVTAYFDGSTYELPAQSLQAIFTYESWATHLYTNVNPSQVKINEPITLSGSVAPEIPGYPINLMLISPSSLVATKTVYSGADGMFTYTFTPDEEGTWDVKASVGDGLIYTVSINYLDFEVIPLTMIDKASAYGILLITPPYLYATIGLTLVGVISVLYIKREAIIPHLPKSLADKIAVHKKKKKKKSNGGAARFKRKK